jgi:hypothetical protein
MTYEDVTPMLRLKLWLKKRTQELLARGYTEMAEEDREFAELSFEAQKEILS